MEDATLVGSLAVASDLFEAAIEEAERLCPFPYPSRTEPKMILVPQTSAVRAGRLAERMGLRVVVVPLLPEDSWCFVWGQYSIFSEGA